MATISSIKDFYREARKFGVQTLKAGTHPQQWRQTAPTPSKVLQGAGATLGPLGTLGDDIIFEVSLTYEGTQVLQQLRGTLSLASLNRMFRNDVWNELQAYIDGKIDTWVPMDSGDLRNSMHNAISPTQTGKSQGQTFPFRMTLSTPGIDYAKPVNKMPTPWLTHPASYHRNVGRYGSTLQDPEAKYGWYDLVLLNARNKAHPVIQAFFNSISDLLKPIFQKDAYNYARQMFTVRYR